MTGFGGDPAELAARVATQIAEAEERARRAAAVRRDIDAVRGEVRSARGELRVAVDATGRLAELELSERALELRPADLAALILASTREAQRRAGQVAVELAAEAFGADSGVVAQLRGEVEARSAEPRTGDDPEASR